MLASVLPVTGQSNLLRPEASDIGMQFVAQMLSQMKNSNGVIDRKLLGELIRAVNEIQY